MLLCYFPHVGLGLHRASGRVGTSGCPEPPPHLRLGPLRSEGSVIAYYWSEFSIPSHLVEEAERVMAEERAIRLPPRARTLNSFLLTSVVAFRECGPAGCRGWALGGQAGTTAGTGSALQEEKTASCWLLPRGIRKQERGNRPGQ